MTRLWAFEFFLDFDESVVANYKYHSSVKLFPPKITREGLKRSAEAAFRPTGICNLAFAHKGFTVNSYSIVFSVMAFQGIVFLESLLKRWFLQVQLWQIKQWKAWNLSKTAVIKTETFCRRARLSLSVRREV